MLVNVKKFLFIGSAADKETFFKKAQVAGIINFIDTSKKVHHEIPVEVQNVTRAIKV